jgi:predicted nucleic acid-binding Zn finger protein
MDSVDSRRSEGVKCAVFAPSGRKIWTVVGNDYEYWTDPEIPFCSCPDFYFSTLFGGQECYHLSNVREAIKHNGKCETVQFSDAHYPEFISAIAQDAELILSN